MAPVEGFVQRLGPQLLLDGEPFRIAGGNTYYLAYLEEPVLDAALDLAAAFGMNAMRTWAFYDAPKLPGPYEIAFQYWDGGNQAPVIHDGPNGLERLDRAIAKAGERGIRLILTLTNNWDNFGGMPEYAKWFGLPDKNQFYTDERCQEAYRHWVEQIVSRRNSITGRLYRDEAAILAWELANEPRCESHEGVDILLEWIGQMSGFVRGLDANHLIAAGDEGYFKHRWAWGNKLYNGAYGVSCEEILGIGTIDFGTVHMYPEDMKPHQDALEFGLTWIREHIEAGLRADKPMLIEEYGLKVSGEQRDEIFDAWLRSIEELGGVGDLLWLLGLPKGEGQPYQPDAYVISELGTAPSIRDHAMRMLAGRKGQTKTSAPQNH